ncbi:PAS domain-containing protein [Gymnodinialimonas sp. 57CJ19]|uniref:PAS domain-containing protein n=1 Tax=Gymnodinialimonas sp. 57CJ19 TaxID=3138498 RepID=UPI003134533A
MPKEVAVGVQPRNTNRETPFHPEELFFSRADRRGIIRGGNGVFCRVSGYQWDELVGSPHKMVRHDDMPKAVFWLMWKAILAGEPLGAYVKNRAKDGGYYWVYAIVIAQDDEFVSVRLKPTSPMSDTAKSLYADIRALEKTGEVTPEESAQALLARLMDLGYADYASFMSASLSQEIRARDALIARGPNNRMERFAEMLTFLETIRTEGQTIIDGFKAIEDSPKNMRVHATRLGECAAPLGVISSNFHEIATNIKSGIKPFLDGLDHVAECLGRGLFVNCAVSMLSEIIVQFGAEPDRQFAAFTYDEMDRLKAQHPKQTEQGQEVLEDVLRTLAEFAGACLTLKRTLSGLNIMRVMSEIETARIGDPTGSMGEIIMQLHRFQTLTQSCLSSIETHSGRIQSILRKELSVESRLSVRVDQPQATQVNANTGL